MYVYKHIYMYICIYICTYVCIWTSVDEHFNFMIRIFTSVHEYTNLLNDKWSVINASIAVIVYIILIKIIYTSIYKYAVSYLCVLIYIMTEDISATFLHTRFY
jgi:hypothetical protein